MPRSRPRLNTRRSRKLFKFHVLLQSAPKEMHFESDRSHPHCRFSTPRSDWRSGFQVARPFKWGAASPGSRKINGELRSHFIGPSFHAVDANSKQVTSRPRPGWHDDCDPGRKCHVQWSRPPHLLRRVAGTAMPHLTLIDDLDRRAKESSNGCGCKPGHIRHRGRQSEPRLAQIFQRNCRLRNLSSAVAQPTRSQQLANHVLDPGSCRPGDLRIHLRKRMPCGTQSQTHGNPAGSHHAHHNCDLRDNSAISKSNHQRQRAVMSPETHNTRATQLPGSSRGEDKTK